MIITVIKTGENMKHAIIRSFRTLIVFWAVIFFNCLLFAQPNTELTKKYPVILDSDTLFYIYNGIGVLSAEKRAEEITAKLNGLVKNATLNYDSIIITQQDDYLILRLADEPIMAITKTDAGIAGTTEPGLAEMYRGIIVQKLKATREMYSQKALINNGLYTLLFLSLLIIFFWLSIKVFPWIYKKIEQVGSIKIKTLKIRDQEIIRLSNVIKILIGFFKGGRFALSLFVTYFFIIKTLKLWPYTRKWDLQPFIKSIALLIFYSVLFVVVIKGINALTRVMITKYESWKGTLFRSIKIQSVELLSAKRSVEFITLITKIVRLVLLIFLSYIYLTIAFSLFTFSETWAGTLLGYLLSPMNAILTSFLNFLPNLFYITVLVFVFHYIIKMVRFFFVEIEKGTIELPGFYKEWAMPTFKIVRFMILALALIIIFPYLPGSNSPFFKGISIFLGVLFSLGSSSAIANMVAGIVLTYMRPFKLGDRVKIADTMGDVIEKTLLVTRVRTIKNVDITIPNGMILGSHIINYSSSAADRGLILHTTVTIGYDAPWKRVHELLIAAAGETEFVLNEPKPFVLQTSLDDFYVSYELNVYTNEPGKMAVIYSELHSKIQDKFNEAGVEIMSPHYGAMRDGNQTAIPQEYLPKEYKSSAFRIFGVNLFGNQDKDKE
jgi:small-conductance mechanosensitive channel